MKWYVMIWSEMTMYKNGMKMFKCNDAKCNRTYPADVLGIRLSGTGSVYYGHE